MTYFEQPTALPQEPRLDITYYILIAVLLFAALLIISLSILLYFNNYEIKSGLNTYLSNLFFIKHFDIYFGRGFTYDYSAKFDELLSQSAYASAFISAMLSFIYYLNDSNNIQSEIHLAGRRLIDNEAKAAELFDKKMKKEIEHDLNGLALIQTSDNKKLHISQDRETRNILIVGGVGGGKTTIIRNYIEQAIKRKDKCLILDNKSDFTKTLSTEFVLIAPWDLRGAAWDVAKDIETRNDASAFAAAIIEESKEKFWSDASRAILEAMIIRAQSEASKNWDFGYLVDILKCGDLEIKKTVETYTPEFSVLVADIESKTTQSILMTLIANFKNLMQLSDAYSRCETSEKFSFKNWLLDDSNNKTVILQGNRKFEQLQKSLTQAIFKYIANLISSPAFTDIHRKDERRLQLFCDEFPQFGKIEGFESLLETGRSKGVRITIGAQDISQLIKIYSKETLQTWMSLSGTYIICRINGYETAEYFSKTFGKRRVKQYQSSFSNQIGQAGTRTDQWIEQELDVVRQERFGSLNVNKNGVQALVYTADEYVYLLRAKHLTARQKSEKRPASQPARWIQPGWPAAEDIIKAESKNKQSFDFDSEIDAL
jgi:type IV secretory pathway TraG/TraD family ATPase VirD4